MRVQLEAADAPGKALRDSLSGAFARGRDGALAMGTRVTSLQRIQAGLATDAMRIDKQFVAGSATKQQAAFRTAEAVKRATRSATEAGAVEARLAERQALVSRGQATLARAYATTTSALMGYVRAGLSGTTQGNMIALQFQMVSREIANVFLPVIQKVTGALINVTNWFKGLSGSQQALIERFALATVAGLGLAVVLPRLTAGFVLMGGGVKALTAALMANPFVAVAAGIVALLTATEEGRLALGELVKAFAPIGDLLTTILKPMIPVLQEISKVVASVLGPAFKVLGAIIKPIAEAVGFLIKAGTFVATLGNVNLFREQPASRERGGRRELENAGAGPEGLTAVFQRLQTAASRTDYAQATAQNTAAGTRILERIERYMNERFPSRRGVPLVEAAVGND